MDDRTSGRMQRVDSSYDNEKIMNMINDSIQTMLPQITENIRQEIKKEYQQKINELTARIDKLEKSMTKGDKQTEVSTTPFTPSPKTLSQGEMMRISFFGFKYGEWIFYINDNNGDFLYKVKTDGTQNTQLTGYSVRGCFSIEDGYLCFDDSHCRKKKIKL